MCLIVSHICVGLWFLPYFASISATETSPIPVLEFQRSLCLCVCACRRVCAPVCVGARASLCARMCVSSVCACVRSPSRALEAYGNCGLPTGLLGRVCASGSGASRLVSAAFIHSAQHSPHGSVRPRCWSGRSLSTQLEGDTGLSAERNNPKSTSRQPESAIGEDME